MVAWGTVALAGLRTSPYPADLAITDAGGLCVAGDAWATGPADTAGEFGGLGAPVVARIGPAGALDLAFGDGGVLVVDDAVGGFAVAAAPDDGCWLAVGTERVSSTSYDAAAARVLRVDAAGVVDPLARSPVFAHGGTVERIHDLAPLADGGALVLGTGAKTAWVARITTDGALDPGWGAGGERLLPVALDCEGTSFCDEGSVVVLADGSALVSVGHPATLVKLTPAGDVDPAYGSAGVAASSGAFRAAGMAAAPDGLALLGGAAHDGTRNLPRVERLDSGGGVALAPTWVDVGAVDAVHDVALDAEGRALLVGTAGRPVVARALADGTPDPAWGAGGAWTFPSGRGGDSGALAVAGNGTVVAAAMDLAAEEVVVAALPP